LPVLFLVIAETQKSTNVPIDFCYYKSKTSRSQVLRMVDTAALPHHPGMVRKNKKIRGIIVLSILLILALTTVNIVVSYYSTIHAAEVSIANQSIGMAESIAADLDVEAYERFLQHRTREADFWAIAAYLNDAKKKIGATYVYTLLVDNPEVTKTMIHGMDQAHPIDYYIGEYCTVPKQQIALALQGKTYSTGILRDAKLGDYMSVGAPIRDESGNMIGYLGIDMGSARVQDIGQVVIANSYATFFFNVVFVLVLLVLFLVIQRWYQRETKKAVGETELTYQAEFRSILTSVRSIRHDFVNHIQVLYGLLEFKYYPRAIEYIQSLFKEIKLVDLTLKINNPALLVLFQSKWVLAQNKQIELEFDVMPDTFDRIESTDLIRILSNLMDNAIEAVQEIPQAERKMKVTCKSAGNHYWFEVENAGRPISERDRAYLFDEGFTSKPQSSDRPRGFGLSIVKQIVHRYSGEIDFVSGGQRTAFSVRIPIVATDR